MGRDPFEPLAASLRGDLILPGDGAYDQARRVWNGMVDTRPAAIARCSGVADVIAAVNFARGQGLRVAVRGGGHGVAGNAMRDGALVVDLSALREVSVDPLRRLARVSAGAKLGDLDHETQAFGLATAAGIDSRTGVAGLTLGGGQGFLSRRFGLSVDSLRAVEVVTADGRLRRATEEEHADLLWAARGGRGAGVVTRFEFDLHPVGPEVLVAQAFHPLASACEVLAFYRTLMAEAPDEFACYAMFLRLPPDPTIAAEHHGQVSVALVACHSGEPAEGRRWVDRVAAYGEPILVAAVPMPYRVLQSSFDAGAPEGARYYWKAHYLRDLPDAVIDVLAGHAADLPPPYSIVGLEPMGGAIARVPAFATAFPHRDAVFTLGIWAGWERAEDDESAIAWTRQLHEALAPYATGGVYSNYLDRDDAGRAGAAYGANEARLQEIRRRYDPDGMFQ